MAGAQLYPVNASTAGFVYLILILAVATLSGLAEAVVTSVVAVLCYNFFFLPPVGEFTISDPENWVALFTFLVTALVASQLSHRAQSQAAEAKRRQRESEQLYAVSRSILLSDAAQPVGSQAAQQISQTFGAAAVVLYDSQAKTLFRGGPGELTGIEPLLKEVVLLGGHHHDAGGFDVWPITLGGVPVGALAARGIVLSEGGVQSLLNLVAIAFERARGEELAQRAEVARQSEELKSTLLDAIAHEFKTPLTSIKAAATSLLAGPDGMTEGQRDLAAVIDEEAERLSLLVTEAVRLAQIDAGKVAVERGPCRPASIVQAAVTAFAGRGEERIQAIDLEALPPVLVDADLIALALRQILDNALKYSPPNSPVQVRAAVQPDRVILQITDQGPGIPERDRERVFEKFFRRAGTAEKIPGSGLGLHIARDIARLNGGDLWLDHAPQGGAQFHLALPQVQMPQVPETGS